MANTEKVGVALAAMVVSTVGVGGAKHCPSVGLVSQINSDSGGLADPVSTVATTVAALPTFTEATAKAPEPVLPGRLRMPSLVGVAPRATISGTAVVEADRSKVLTPSITPPIMLFEQSKFNGTS